MSKRCLVIGGTGPTGPYIVRGLRDRGYEVTILHRGTHEPEEVRDFEHLHADPNFEEPLADAVGKRTFDLVVATYGRVRLLPNVLRGRTDRLITIGGTAYADTRSRPATETAPRYTENKIVARIVEAELALRLGHESGYYRLTHFRYPNLFGPRQLAPREWSIIRRIRDGRRRLPILDQGLTLESRAYVENAAHAVLLGVDHPERSNGQFYNVADKYTPCDADRVMAIAAAMGVEIELVNFNADAGAPAFYWGIGRDLSFSREGRAPRTRHKLLDISKINRELGYEDLVQFDDAIARTVDHYVRNPCTPEEEHQIGDPFDYEAEDRFIAALDDFVTRTRAIPFQTIEYIHQYDHPKAPDAITPHAQRMTEVSAETMNPPRME